MDQCICCYIFDTGFISDCVVLMGNLFNPSDLTIAKGWLCGDMSKWFMVCADDDVSIFNIKAEFFKIINDYK